MFAEVRRMVDDDAVGDELLVALAEELHRFMHAHAHHYAVRALVDVMAREAAGEPVDPDERMMALTTLVHTLRERRR